MYTQYDHIIHNRVYKVSNMKDFPWSEFYERYVINGEEFSFLYQGKYRT